MLNSKKILVAVTGSIAAYKAATLVRLLVKNNAEVKVIMTDAATHFIPALTLSTLSKNTVLQDISSNDQWANHVELGRWADLMIVAPLSCNTLAKMANGLCDNLLLAVYLSATCPVIVAPAMDEDMWMHPSTKKNINTLDSFGVKMISVNKGELASGLFGEGRMAEPEEILEHVHQFFNQGLDLSDKNILITAGPTFEAIDPVRFIGNHSSGKMGIALAIECKKRGANVHLVLGPSTEKIPANITVSNVVSAQEMFDVCNAKFSSQDIAIMAAAVADFTPVEVAKHKIKKSAANLTVELKKTIDILATLGTQKTPNQLLIGFALETNDEKENALKKLQSKNADMIVLNSLNDKGAGFGGDSNKITIFDRLGNEQSFETKSKQLTAVDIINSIIKFQHA